MIELSWNNQGLEKGLFRGFSIITIGRNIINDIIIKNHQVSAYHAAIIENEQGQYFARDLGSLNGLQVNGKNCYRRILKLEDEISICGFIIRVTGLHPGQGEFDDKRFPINPLLNREIPILEITEKPLPLDLLPSKTKFIKSIQEVSPKASALISEIIKLDETDSIISQLIKELSDTFMEAQSGYLALFDQNHKPILKKILRLKPNELPELPQKAYLKLIKTQKPQLFELKDAIRVALIPLKGIESLLGFVYLFNLSPDCYTLDKKQELSQLIEQLDLQQHLDRCFSDKIFFHQADKNITFKWKEKFIGYQKTAAMEDCYKKIKELGRTDKPVVILGETGTGKTELAQKIHWLSKRRDKTFLRVDLNTISDTLVEAEMFGSVKGGFTGSIKDRVGFFEYAQEGTVFLDEIGNLPITIQNKLLQPLDDKPFIRRIGSVKEIPVNVRIIAATNKDIEGAVREGKFKEDLYRRLGIGMTSIYLPPLRDRKEDIPLLANFFIDQLGDSQSVEVLSRSARDALMEYDWPGNIGTLRGAILQGMTLAEAEGRRIISISDLPDRIANNPSGINETTQKGQFPTLEEMEKTHILMALKKTGFKKAQAAALLGITRPTLNAKISKYQIVFPNGLPES